MKKDQTVRMMTPGQMKEIISAMVEGVPANMAFETANGWVGNKGKLTSQVRKIFSAVNPYAGLFADWQVFYYNTFGIEANFNDLQIPEKRQDFNRLIIVAKGMTPQKLFNKCAELFSCWKWTDKSLDEVVDLSFQNRSSKNKSYAIWLRDRIEADEELKNLSAENLKQQDILGITLEERLIYELKYFKETGKHLDIKNITLCTGSRDRGGGVPRVHFYPNTGEVRVDWAYPDFGYDYLRSRQAVSV